MTFDEIRADIASALGMTISSSSRITTTERDQWINQDYRTAQSKMADANINFFQGEIQERDVEDGVGKYQLPNKFLAMKRLEIQYNDDEDKIMADPIDINDIYSTLDPDDDPWSQSKPFYAIWENDFYLKPVPDDDSDDWTTDSGSAMRMWFVQMQDDLSAGTDEPALPMAYHHLLAYGATARGFRKLRKFAEAKEYDILRRTGFAEMVAENTHKDKTKGLAFKITRGVNKSHGVWRP